MAIEAAIVAECELVEIGIEVLVAQTVIGAGSSIPPRPRRSLLRAPWKLLIGLQIRPGRGSSTQNISIHAPAGFGWRGCPTTRQLPCTRSSEETSNREPRC